MKNKKRLIAIICAIALLLTGGIIAFASQENELDVHTEHTYRVAAFKDGVVKFKCDGCEDTIYVNFFEHINERNYDLLDVVEDGVINAKDYAYLKQHYNSFGAINGFDDEGGSDWEGPDIGF